MNLFVLHKNPVLAAIYACNKHQIKMPTEVSNMVLWAFKLQLDIPLPLSKNGTPIKLSHKNHPCSLWVRASKANFDWAVTHLNTLLVEYKLRYNRVHYSQKYLDFILENRSKLTFAKTELTPFARCFGEFKEILDATVADTVEAYREFYWLDKIDFAKWPSERHIPNWWGEMSKVTFRQSHFVDKAFEDGKYLKRKQTETSGLEKASQLLEGSLRLLFKTPKTQQAALELFVEHYNIK